ncbi:hypothetical protein AeMF1_001409 [Aphanomyces euteiches]|nr:hypothetical protein AeMF1_001409 [Aphanomyces euteiches]KAH9131426.1 hypothetical protein AeNC1_019643 [Aphanomyces euteiches]
MSFHYPDASAKMFSGGGRNQHGADDTKKKKNRDWLNVGQTYVDALLSDDSEDEALKRASEMSTKIVRASPRKEERKEPTRKPLPPTRESAVFEIDHGGDKENLFYGTLAAKDTPRYHLVKRRKYNENDTSVRYFDPKLQPHRRLYAFPEKTRDSSALDLSASFINVDPFEDIADDDENLQTENQRLEEHIMAQNKRFNENLRASPHNISLWIKYIAAQEREGIFVKNKHKQRSVVLEKQQSILQKALQANPTSIELKKITWLMALQLPEESQVVDHLEKQIHAAPDNEMLWFLMIHRTQEQFSEFSLPRLRNLYARILQTIQTVNNPSASASLVLFFWLLCMLEVKSGYTERGVSLMQALLEFNCGMPLKLSGSPLSALKHSFEAFWDQDLRRYGESGHVSWSSWHENEVQPSPVEIQTEYASQLLPSMETYMNRLHEHVHKELLDVMQPPVHLKKDPDHANSGDKVHDDDADNDASSKELEEEYVWSNLHGYRIPIQDAQDTVEYQRILQELRSNRPVPVKKQKKQELAKHDERLDFDLVAVDDVQVHLLQEEEILQATQWRPLHARSPEDAAMVEAQPDRVLLSEEIQPFLFKVDSTWHTELVLSYLSLLGVTSRTRRPAEALEWLYQDDISGGNGMIAACVEMFQHRKHSSADVFELLHILLHERLEITREALDDPSRVTHIRHLLWQTKQPLLLMEYETKLAIHLNLPEVPRGLAKQLLATASQDMALWEQYTIMEWSLGNPKQVSRICDKTIESLANSSSLDRHRFLTLRLRMELFGDSTVTHESKWRCVYLAYKAFYPEADSLTKVWKKLDKKNAPYDTIVPASAMRPLRLRLQQQVDEANKLASAQASLHTLQRPALVYCVYNHAIVLLAVEGRSAACRYLRKWIDTAKSNCKPETRVLEPDGWSSAVEWLVAAYLDLLKRLGSSPREWRHTTQLAMNLMPLHSTFVHLFVDAEQSNTMNQQVRRVVQLAHSTSRLNFDAASPMVHLMALLGEVYRLKKTNALDIESTCCGVHQWGSVAIHRIRRVFEDAVDNVSWRSQGSALLWRLYLRFEIQTGQVQQAIKVFYRAIHKCPWSKALYFDSIRVLRPYLTDENVQEILGILVSKELYLRYES